VQTMQSLKMPLGTVSPHEHLFDLLPLMVVVVGGLLKVSYCLIVSLVCYYIKSIVVSFGTHPESHRTTS
jgi:hypothetical protein